MKRGKDACDTPRLNARRFEELVVGKIRSNILTESSITELVKVVDEEMDGVAREQRKRLQTVEDELEDVKRKLGRIWHVIETTDIDIADAAGRIKEHRDRQERLEDAAAEARAILADRRAVLDDVETITAYAKDMRDFLNESELTERRAFIESFVKEIVVMPGDALMRYTVPMPDDSLIPGRAAEKVALNGSVLSTVKNGGPGRIRTYTLPLLRRMRLPVAPLAHNMVVGVTEGNRTPMVHRDHILTGSRYTTITTVGFCSEPLVVNEGLQHGNGLHQVLRVLHHGLDGLVRQRRFIQQRLGIAVIPYSIAHL